MNYLLFSKSFLKTHYKYNINTPLREEEIFIFFFFHFFRQIITLYYIGICYFCFDNVFCIMAIHLTGQFRILGYRFAKLCNIEHEMREKDTVLSKHVHTCYEKFKEYVRYHQALINFYTKLENVYTMIILGQVIVFSALICLFCYQVLLVSIWMKIKLVSNDRRRYKVFQN